LFDHGGDPPVGRRRGLRLGPRERDAWRWRSTSVGRSHPDRHRPRLGACPAPAQTVLDIDATLVTAHSEKEGATPNYRRGLAFTRCCASPTSTTTGSAGTRSPGILRSGRAGAKDVADHISVLDLAIAQLPADRRPRPADPDGPTVLVRADSAGGTYGFPPPCANGPPGTPR